ncbi:metallophosphoesterase family protein [Fodinicurvata halophila]|uniref:Metallophosphoesterase family protein n=1 Tax=Fodinicurvata halophila TaxID=1419723 RepID=A0ABV8UMZ5_9PROT
MKKKDLGTLEGRLLLFGGPYSNLQALEALHARAQTLDINPSHCICNGDVVAYCGDPEASVAFVRNWGIEVAAGNCEEQLAINAADCGCGFEEGSTCEVLSREWYDFARAHLNGSARSWMNELPDCLLFRYAGLRVAVLHATHRANNSFVFPTTPAHEKRQALQALQCDLVVSGHSGLPFTQQLDSGIWHNPGVIGLPANDGFASTWYALLEADENGVRIEHHRLVYDYRKAADRMRSVGLSEAYARALETGLWPSLDVLPQKERNATGQFLRPVSDNPHEAGFIFRVKAIPRENFTQM